MENKENKFKLKITRIFTNSCKTQNLSQVIDHKNPVFNPKTSIFLQAPLMEKDGSFQSPVTKSRQKMMCKPRCPETFDEMIRENCIISTAGNSFPRRKIAGKYTLLSPTGGDFPGRSFPPSSPLKNRGKNHGKNDKKKKKKKTKQRKKNSGENEKNYFRKNPFISFSSSNETDVGDWFSSDDEKEEEEDKTETKFSLKSQSFSSKSISLSSDSDLPSSTRLPSRLRNRRKKASSRRNKGGSVPEKADVMPLQGKVKDTFAVVKSSSDPYNDFRKSMVEMIIEKQIFGAEGLEELLQCFLSLNSPHHHRVIVEVFTEIWDALFSYLS